MRIRERFFGKKSIKYYAIVLSVLLLLTLSLALILQIAQNANKQTQSIDKGVATIHIDLRGGQLRSDEPLPDTIQVAYGDKLFKSTLDKYEQAMSRTDEELGVAFEFEFWSTERTTPVDMFALQDFVVVTQNIDIVAVWQTTATDYNLVVFDDPYENKFDDLLIQTGSKIDRTSERGRKVAQWVWDYVDGKDEFREWRNSTTTQAFDFDTEIVTDYYLFVFDSRKPNISIDMNGVAKVEVILINTSSKETETILTTAGTKLIDILNTLSEDLQKLDWQQKVQEDFVHIDKLTFVVENSTILYSVQDDRVFPTDPQDPGNPKPNQRTLKLGELKLGELAKGEGLENVDIVTGALYFEGANIFEVTELDKIKKVSYQLLDEDGIEFANISIDDNQIINYQDVKGDRENFLYGHFFEYSYVDGVIMYEVSSVIFENKQNPIIWNENDKPLSSDFFATIDSTKSITLKVQINLFDSTTLIGDRTYSMESLLK